MQCLGNLKQISLAMHQYHNVHSVLPPGKKGCCWGTWLVYSLPYLEQQAMFNAWNSCGINSPGVPANYDLDLRYFGAANVTVTSSRVNVYLCPSDLTNAPITAAINGKTYACTSQNYAANFGNTTVLQTDFQGTTFGGAPFVDIGSPLGDYDQPARARPLVSTRLPMGSATRCSSPRSSWDRDRIFVGSRGGATPPPSRRSPLPNSPFPDVLFSPIYCINQPPNPPCTSATTALPEMYAARSRHAGGVNMATADGAVRFKKNSIALSVWRELSTSAGNEFTCIGGDPY